VLLHPVLQQLPFEKWGLDYVGLIKPTKQGNQAKYIIVAMDYLTKLADARAIWNVNAHNITKFIYEQIITRFECPIEMVTHRGTHFINEVIIEHLTKIMIIHNLKSTPYYHRGNGQAKSIDNILRGILIKIYEVKRTDWESKLHYAFWAYQTTYKTSNGKTPFQLAYRLEVVMPIGFMLPTLHIVVKKRLVDIDSHTKMLVSLENLTKVRMLTIYAMVVQK